MLTLRRANERGHADHGWLSSHHSFSFADYHDPREMGWGTLRVINEDRVAPGMGFGTHPHRDMEIISYVLSGALEHRDSLGTGSVIRPGDVQRMSAGTGVTHSEFNHSREGPVHFLQIWILPKVLGVKPGYEQKTFSAAEKSGRLRLIASPDGADGSVTIHQDAWVYATLLGADQRVVLPVVASHLVYVHVVRGNVAVGGERLGPGDGAKIARVDEIVLDRADGAEVLVFDMA